MRRQGSHEYHSPNNYHPDPLSDTLSGVGKIRHSGDACGPVPAEDDGRSRVNVHTTQIDDLQLIALPSAVNCAEMFVRFTVTEWSLRPLADEATFVARH